MKKTYINPELEVIKIATMQMLALSVSTEKSGDYGEGDDVDMPGFTDIEELDIFKNL